MVTAVPCRPPRARKGKLPFSERPFIAWDGEGEHTPGERGKYILFGCSTGQDISGPSLRASECFELLLSVSAQQPDAIHVAYAFNYDVAMMCNSLPVEVWQRLADEGMVRWRSYTIRFFPRKWFSVRCSATGRSIKVYDIFTFFLTSALKAWQQYLPDEPVLKIVHEGKAGRLDFSYSSLDFIREYMHHELVLYEKLATRLRELLAEIDVHPKGWHGPGAVAQALLALNNVGEALSRSLPERVARASQHAYFGGPFEQYCAGQYTGPVYAYDIRSAFPHGLRQVPNIARGRWTHTTGNRHVPSYSLCRVEYRRTHGHDGLLLPGMLPHRDRLHRISYPLDTDGWYWGVEVQAVLDTLPPDVTLHIHEMWIFEPDDPGDKPLAFINDLYHQRMEWKNEGNPVEYATKVGLNSLYGKLAQRVGHKNGQPPQWHQLEYAGYCVAVTRALIRRAVQQKPWAVIAVQADALYTTEPLDLPLSDNLGDWEMEQYDGIMYVQSGVYWLARDGKWEKQKIRGFGVGEVSVVDAENAVTDLSPITANTTRFIGIKAARGEDAVLSQWMEAPRELEWGGGGKRMHNAELCPKCTGSGDQMHRLVISRPVPGDFSHKHVLPWIDEEINPFWEGELGAEGQGSTEGVQALAGLVRGSQPPMGNSPSR